MCRSVGHNSPQSCLQIDAESTRRQPTKQSLSSAAKSAGSSAED
jgi:hypothetical protein